MCIFSEFSIRTHGHEQLSRVSKIDNGTMCAKDNTWLAKNFICKVLNYFIEGIRSTQVYGIHQKTRSKVAYLELRHKKNSSSFLGLRESGLAICKRKEVSEVKFHVVCQ